MRTRDSLPKPNIVKKSLKGVYPFWANLYQKLPISAILGAHILKVTMVKFGTRMRSWESLPKSNFI